MFKIHYPRYAVLTSFLQFINIHAVFSITRAIITLVIMLKNVMHWNIFNFLMFSVAVHGVTKNILNFAY